MFMPNLRALRPQKSLVVSGALHRASHQTPSQGSLGLVRRLLSLEPRMHLPSSSLLTPLTEVMPGRRVAFLWLCSWSVGH